MLTALELKIIRTSLKYFTGKLASLPTTAINILKIAEYQQQLKHSVFLPENESIDQIFYTFAENVVPGCCPLFSVVNKVTELFGSGLLPIEWMLEGKDCDEDLKLKNLFDRYQILYALIINSDQPFDELETELAELKYLFKSICSFKNSASAPTASAPQYKKHSPLKRKAVLQEALLPFKEQLITILANSPEEHLQFVHMVFPNLFHLLEQKVTAKNNYYFANIIQKFSQTDTVTILDFATSLIDWIDHSHRHHLTYDEQLRYQALEFIAYHLLNAYLQYLNSYFNSLCNGLVSTPLEQISLFISALRNAEIYGQRKPLVAGCSEIMKQAQVLKQQAENLKFLIQSYPEQSMMLIGRDSGNRKNSYSYFNALFSCDSTRQIILGHMEKQQNGLYAAIALHQVAENEVITNFPDFMLLLLKHKAKDPLWLDTISRLIEQALISNIEQHDANYYLSSAIHTLHCAFNQREAATTVNGLAEIVGKHDALLARLSGAALAKLAQYSQSFTQRLMPPKYSWQWFKNLIFGNHYLSRMKPIDVVSLVIHGNDTHRSAALKDKHTKNLLRNLFAKQPNQFDAVLTSQPKFLFSIRWPAKSSQAQQMKELEGALVYINEHDSGRGVKEISDATARLLAKIVIAKPDVRENLLKLHRFWNQIIFAADIDDALRIYQQISSCSCSDRILRGAIATLCMRLQWSENIPSFIKNDIFWKLFSYDNNGMEEVFKNRKFIAALNQQAGNPQLIETISKNLTIAYKIVLFSCLSQNSPLKSVLEQELLRRRHIPTQQEMLGYNTPSIVTRSVNSKASYPHGIGREPKRQEQAVQFISPGMELRT